MSTKLWLYSGSTATRVAHWSNAEWNYGNGFTRERLQGGGSYSFISCSLTGHQNNDGLGVVVINHATVAGPVTDPGAETSNPCFEFMSAPLAADVTISGSIVTHLWANETSMSANATIGAAVDRVRGDGTIDYVIGIGELGTELSTSSAAYDITFTPTSTDFHKGDRIRVRTFINDATSTTMASGYNVQYTVSGATAGANGDTYVTFTETISFDTASSPAGTTIYLTNTASDVATAAVDREAWTSRGGGAQNDVTNTAVLPSTPVQVTDTAGGTVVDWWTKQLQAFTLGGSVLVNFCGRESGVAANVTWRCQIAITNSDGSSPVVWAESSSFTELDATAEAVVQFMVAGPDVSVSDGQRLRVRMSLTNAYHIYGQSYMMSGYTATTYYAGAASGSGDAYLTFTNTLAEYTPPAGGDVGMPYIGGGYYS